MCYYSGERKTRDVLVLLLSHPNINISLKNDAGDTALDLAKRHNENAELFKLHAPHIAIS